MHTHVLSHTRHVNTQTPCTQAHTHTNTQARARARALSLSLSLSLTCAYACMHAAVQVSLPNYEHMVKSQQSTSRYTITVLARSLESRHFHLVAEVFSRERGRAESGQCRGISIDDAAADTPPWLYVCMHVCMLRVYACMQVCIGCMCVCMACMWVCLYVCMSVCVSACIHL